MYALWKKSRHLLKQERSNVVLESKQKNRQSTNHNKNISKQNRSLEQSPLVLGGNKLRSLVLSIITITIFNSSINTAILIIVQQFSFRYASGKTFFYCFLHHLLTSTSCACLFRSTHRQHSKYQLLFFPTTKGFFIIKVPTNNVVFIFKINTF